MILGCFKNVMEGIKVRLKVIFDASEIEILCGKNHTINGYFHMLAYYKKKTIEIL